MPHPETMPTGPESSAAAARLDDTQLLAALRAGDESGFIALVERHHVALVRLAMAYVPSRAIAEEVAQDAWVGFIQGLDRFEGRSSLKTWLFHILTNLAKTRGERERRSVSFTDLVAAATAEGERAVARERFQPADGKYPGHWAAAPRPWDMPEQRLLGKEVRAVVDAAVAALPAAQRQVITLRDVEGWSAGEVCDALEISDANQRVLLHRARSRVRAVLEDYEASENVTRSKRNQPGLITRLLRRPR
jgi:RNA polymerase sigma-70 factor, ECF subfamily